MMTRCGEAFAWRTSLPDTKPPQHACSIACLSKSTQASSSPWWDVLAAGSRRWCCSSAPTGRKPRNHSATRIVVTSRLFTLRRADCVIVLDNGRVVEQGSCERLLLDERGALTHLAWGEG